MLILQTAMVSCVTEGEENKTHTPGVLAPTAEGTTM